MTDYRSAANTQWRGFKRIFTIWDRSNLRLISDFESWPWFFWTRTRLHRLWTQKTGHTWYCSKSWPYHHLHESIFYRPGESVESIERNIPIKKQHEYSCCFFRFFYSFGITASIAPKVASLPAGIRIVTVSPISALKWVTAAVRTS